MDQPPVASTAFSLRQAFFEAFFVLLGVALALAANAWWQHRRDENRADVALASIEIELRTNRDLVQSALDYHNEKLELLQSWDAPAPPSPREFSRGFVSPARVLSAAWDTAGASEALITIDYEVLLVLSRAYANQEAYESQARLVGDIIYRTIFDRGMTGLLEEYRNLASIIATFAYRERQLIEMFDETLVALTPDGA